MDGEDGTNLVTVTLHAVIDDHFNVNGFVKGETQRALSNESFPVGKGISVANALAGLGRANDTSVIVLCGDDTREIFQTQLEQQGFGKLVVRSEAFKTRRHVTISDPTTKGVTHIQVQGVLHPPRLFEEGGTLMRCLLDIPKPTSIVALSGSLPKGAPTDFYATLIERMQNRGARVVLDTSGAPLMSALKSHPFAIKPNRVEAETIVGRPLPGIQSQTSISSLR